jgi:hypothetical protein
MRMVLPMAAVRHRLDARRTTAAASAIAVFRSQ